MKKNKLPKSPQELLRILPNDLKQLLFKQWSAKQNPKWHPEGNTLKHIFIVIKRAYAKYGGDPNMVLAALFHDLGKMDTYKISPKTNQPTAHGHEKESEKYVEEFRNWIESFEGTDVDKIKFIVKNHMKVKSNVWDVMKQKKKDKLMNITDPETGEIKPNPYFKSLSDFEKYLDGGGSDIIKEYIKHRLRNII